MKKELLILFLAITLIGCSQIENVDVPLGANQGKLTVTQLDNGLTITIKEAHSIPLATIQFWVKVGSKNEPDEFRGIAHVFEHMWFKGTATQPVGSFHKKVESLGGELNAMTSMDWTMYYVTLPSDKFNDIFPYMVDLLKNPAFDPTEIEKEKEVVIEEQRFSENEPEKFADDKFAKLLIQTHKYGDPIIGFKDTIKAPTPKDIKEFYNTWYVPNNMNVVVAGDVNPKEITKTVTEALGSLPKKTLPEQTKIVEPIPAQQRYDSARRDVSFSYIAMGFQAPKALDNDKYAFEVLNTIWGKGKSSRLQKLQQNNIISRGDTYYLALNELGVIETVIVTEKAQAAPATALLMLEFNKFKTTLVSKEELNRAKQLIRTDNVKSKEEIFQRGFEIGQNWIDGDINLHKTYLEKINQVSTQDVQNVAQKYFIAPTIFEVKPKL